MKLLVYSNFRSYEELHIMNWISREIKKRNNYRRIGIILSLTIIIFVSGHLDLKRQKQNYVKVYVGCNFMTKI